MEPISDDEGRPVIRSHIFPAEGKKRNKNEFYSERQRPQHHILPIFKPSDIPRVGCNKPPKAADDHRSRAELKKAAYCSGQMSSGMISPGQKENAASFPQNSGGLAANRRPVQSKKSGANPIRPYINQEERKLKETDREKTKKIAALEAKNTFLKAEKGTLKDEVGMLTAKVEKKEKKVERLKKELKEKEELAEKNMKIVKEKKSELNKVQAQLKERTEELNKLKAHNEKQGREKKDLCNQMEQRDKKIAELELKIEDLENKWNNAVQQMKDLQYLQEQHSTAGSDISVYQQKLTEMFLVKKSLEIDKKTLEEANGYLQKKIRDGAVFEERLVEELQFCIKYCRQLEYQNHVLIRYLKNPTQKAVPKPTDAAGSSRPTVKRSAKEDDQPLTSGFKGPAGIKKIKKEHRDEVIVLKIVKPRAMKNVVQVKPPPLSPPSFSLPTPSFVPNTQSRF